MNSDSEKTLDALWCVDSETREKVLIDLKTGAVIATESCIKCQSDNKNKSIDKNIL